MLLRADTGRSGFPGDWPEVWVSKSRGEIFRQENNRGEYPGWWNSRNPKVGPAGLVWGVSDWSSQGDGTGGASKVNRHWIQESMSPEFLGPEPGPWSPKSLAWPFVLEQWTMKQTLVTSRERRFMPWGHMGKIKKLSGTPSSEYWHEVCV